MRRLLTVLAAAGVVALAPAVPAIAAPDNSHTLHFVLDCGASGAFNVEFQPSSSDSFHVVGTTTNFLWKSLDYVTPDGATGRIERGVQGNGHSLLVCHYTGAVSGNHYTATGFFTA